MTCPCCGGELPADKTLDGLVYILPPVQSAILRALREAGGYLKSGDLIDRVWGRSKDGPPRHAPQALTAVVRRLRASLEPEGWTIASRPHHGYALRRIAA